MEKYWLISACILACVSIATSLECFACSNQDDNKGKCRKTTKQCEEFQDACTTYIRWGVPPYWTPRGDRIYYISKDCDTMKGCERRRAATSTHCKRDWYNDWACVECCTGDLCNYYVTLGSGTLKVSIFTMVSAILGYWVFREVL